MSVTWTKVVYALQLIDHCHTILRNARYELFVTSNAKPKICIIIVLIPKLRPDVYKYSYKPDWQPEEWKGVRTMVGARFLTNRCK